MTFWDLIAKGFVYLNDKWTRVLGLAAGTLVTLTGTGIIPDKNLKYWMAAIALLTYWRGSSTGKTYNQAKAVLASATAPIVIGPSVTMAQVKDPTPSEKP